ncbi:sulfite exporter TauE/SafE family protein [Actibacterium sp. XHP0104]|uniref:sulfite exporter TauE/SafE family protein n=1 Tax=Actibacterium sp. XHP0104 TaxID=2984335 RepID=UPI0021E885F9|nr:sulfite exporter TauE/SafE family protein [Actibacterium sp. XHP0104]MCV2882636.1 sulfite exporter TauE/SafE family protein [Actibacterium sp. XHP0104]
MITFDLMFFVLAIPAVIFAGISKAGFGSGAAFAATPILALILPPAAAVGLMLPLLMLVDLATLGPYWRRWDTRAALLLIAGAVPGVALGALLFRAADPDLFRLLIGAVALGFVLYQLALRAGLFRIRGRPFPQWGGVVAGTTAGFTSFISHAGGPPVAVFLLAQGLGKTTFQATTVLVFWIINLLKFVPYAALGFFSNDTLRADLMLAPFALIGAWLGVRAHRLMPERAFFAVTYVLLTVTGAKLIWDGLI